MDSGEVHFVRCLKCQKILKCSRYDTAALLQHIRSDHPEVEIVDSDSKIVKRKVDKSTEISNRNRSPKSPNEQEAGDEEARRPPEKSETIIDVQEDKDFEAVPRSVKRINFESNQEKAESAPIYVPEEDLTHLSMRSELCKSIVIIHGSA